MCSCVTRGYCRSDPCESPFAQLAFLFGEDNTGFTIQKSRYLPETDVRASLCLTRHLNLRPRTPRKLDLAGLEAKMLVDCDAWRVDPLLISFRPYINITPGEHTGTHSRTMGRLMTYAMGVEQERYATMKDAMQSSNSYTWSFCKDKWVPRHRTVHCEHCDVCYDSAWHCEECETCKAGRNLPCDGCGGWSEDGVRNGEDGAKAPDAHKAQRGLSQVSPRKRPRQTELWNGEISEVSVHCSYQLYVDTDISLSRLYPRLPTTSRLVRVTAKMAAVVGGAYVVVGAETARPVASVTTALRVLA